MTYIVKLDGKEIARLTGEHIQFGRKVASGSLMEKQMVEDRSILKQLDAGGNTIWVMMLSHRNLTVEEVT